MLDYVFTMSLMPISMSLYFICSDNFSCLNSGGTYYSSPKSSMWVMLLTHHMHVNSKSNSFLSSIRFYFLIFFNMRINFSTYSTSSNNFDIDVRTSEKKEDKHRSHKLAPYITRVIIKSRLAELMKSWLANIRIYNLFHNHPTNQIPLASWGLALELWESNLGSYISQL